MKPDEAAFLRACFDAQEDRERKGWYEYGVTLDLGWFTPEGIAAVEAMKETTA